MSQPYRPEYLKSAKEKEARRDWSGAAQDYEMAEAWELAGDVYMRSAQEAQADSHFTAEQNRAIFYDRAQECYFKAGRHEKMVNAYLRELPLGTLSDRAIERLGQTKQWEVFLSLAHGENPLALGNMLYHHLLRFHLRNVPGGTPLEADVLERCFDAVGPAKLKLGTTLDWLDEVAKFWRWQGNAVKAAEVSVRRTNTGVELQETNELRYRHLLAAWLLADLSRFAEAAQEMKKAAEYLDRDRGAMLLEWAAKICERAGEVKSAAALYKRTGRHAKAARVTGGRQFDLDEVSILIARVALPDSSREWVKNRVAELLAAKEPRKATQELFDDLEKWAREGAMSMWEDWLVVPVVYRSIGDQQAYRSAIAKTEQKLRARGQWDEVARLYLFEQLYDDFDALCLEEDELEVAALWYEQANMPERAAKIYDLMGQSGKSGKAQSEGAKQKSQDTAKPKSDSAEESDRSDVDQLVCPQCGAEVKPHWTACPKCDAELKMRKCRNCGEPLEPDWKKCPACRAAVAPSD